MSDDKKIEFAVKKYLQKNPDFFAKNPELMTEIEVVNSNGELTNLTTHQLRTLQKENRKLKNQMAQLIANAQQSERLMNRLLTMLTELTLVSENDFIPGFVNYIQNHFPSDYFKLLLTEGLHTGEDLEHVATLTAAHMTHFSAFQVKSEPMSGRLKQEKISSIFGEDHSIKSAVVMPIGLNAQYGMMSFASKDEEKFHPHSSTDILQKLSQILATYFTQQKNKDEYQAMS
jgi:uncharacterized protein YigA (DUF484 family)